MTELCLKQWRSLRGSLLCQGEDQACSAWNRMLAQQVGRQQKCLLLVWIQVCPSLLRHPIAYKVVDIFL